MSTVTSVDAAHQPRKWKVATVSLAGCFGCHTSFLDIDERLLALIEHVEFDRSPLTDIKEVGKCENVLVLRAFRANCKTLVAMGACAINGGLPAERNRFDLAGLLNEVYHDRAGLSEDSEIPNDPELPLLLRQVRPIHAVVHVDYFLPGCPPSADAFWSFLNDLMAGRTPHLTPALMHYD
jgi:NAD-reducing hydrogenase small subunit